MNFFISLWTWVLPASSAPVSMQEELLASAAVRMQQLRPSQCEWKCNKFMINENILKLKLLSLYISSKVDSGLQKQINHKPWWMACSSVMGLSLEPFPSSCLSLAVIIIVDSWVFFPLFEAISAEAEPVARVFCKQCWYLCVWMGEGAGVSSNKQSEGGRELSMDDLLGSVVQGPHPDPPGHVEHINAQVLGLPWGK